LKKKTNKKEVKTSFPKATQKSFLFSPSLLLGQPRHVHSLEKVFAIRYTSAEKKTAKEFHTGRPP